MNAPTDFNALKTRQQTAWASGDYAVIGTTLQLVGEQLAEACDLRWDERVLDVAAGNGNATLAAQLAAIASGADTASGTATLAAQLAATAGLVLSRLGVLLVPALLAAASRVALVWGLVPAEQRAATTEALAPALAPLLSEPGVLDVLRVALSLADDAALGTVGVRVRVMRVDARAKLSQNKPPEVVQRIVAELEGDGPYNHASLAREMRRHHDARDS